MSCSCFTVECVGAAVSPADRGVEGYNVAIMLPQHPGAVAIFIALYTGRRDNRVARGASPWEEKSPRKHSIASLTHSTLGITLPLESMSCFREGFL